MAYWFLVAALVCFAIALIMQENKIHKLHKKFCALADKHNWLIDTDLEMYDEVIGQFNDRIDEINHEFHNVYDILNAAKNFSDEVTDTMELMCDTDEIMIDRINDIEDALDEMEEELAFVNVSIDDLDSILYEMFEEQPEEEETKTKKTKKK